MSEVEINENIENLRRSRREYYHRNKQKFKEYYRQTKERRIEYQKAYASQNKKEIEEYQSKYWLKRKKKIRALKLLNIHKSKPDISITIDRQPITLTFD